MALKDLVVDNAEREAMRLVEPYAHQLWPRDAKQLTDNIASSLRAITKERDDALLAAQIVRDLATPPVSDEDVERAVAEARRVRPAIARKQADRISSLEEENRRMRDEIWTETQRRERFEEDVWCAHKWLDDRGIPRTDVGGEVFSLVGRMMRLAARAALSQEEKP